MGRAVSVALQAKNLPRIHDVLRVQRTLDDAHHVDGTVASFCDQKIHFVHAHVALARTRIFKRQRARDELVVQLYCYPPFFWNSRINQVAKEQVTVAHIARSMEYLLQQLLQLTPAGNRPNAKSAHICRFGTC